MNNFIIIIMYCPNISHKLTTIIFIIQTIIPIKPSIINKILILVKILEIDEDI